MARGGDAKLGQAAQFYVWNHIQGKSLREIAQKTGCHATTVMRHIQRICDHRDDPDVHALIETIAGRPQTLGAGVQDEFNRAAKLLKQVDTLLAVAGDMDRALIIGKTEDGNFHQLDAISQDAAHILLVRLHLKSVSRGRVSRYCHPNPTLRAKWRDQILNVHDQTAVLPVRGEAPLKILARRRDGQGDAFLSRDLVQAGLRLSEDFILSAAGSYVQDNINDISAILGFTAKSNMTGDAAAWGRFIAALRELGPGLAEIAVRSCCLNEGLERSEAALGWSAQSGKVVLRIALVRLKRHYETLYGAGGGQIG